ncbi:MAG TPA: hypothetical protein VHK24_03795, partial [Steroidobacter sp.]|nr:hypothetical protein [Steroidobacter sp.]
MEAATAEHQQALIAQLAQARQGLEGLACDLRRVDDEFEGLANERKQHQLLVQICTALQELSEIGGAALFWGDCAPADAAADQITRARSRADEFQRRVSAIEERREALVAEIRRQENHAETLKDELFEVQEEEERRKQEWLIEREISDLPSRRTVMPWSHGGEDDRRYRKSLATALLLCLLFAAIAPQIELPSNFGKEKAEVPRRVVSLIMEVRKAPPPPPRQATPPPEKKLAEQKLEEEPKQAAMAETETAQKGSAEKPVESKGILAFREKLAALKDAEVVDRLGLQARINDDNSMGRTERSMLSTSAPGSSGGINLASISRSVGGGGGTGMARVQVTRATSAIGAIGSPGGDRPLSGDGPANSRTDEEIQIVFDRYKAA